MKYIIIGLCLVYAIWQILRHFDVFASSKGASGLKSDIDAEKKKNKDRQKEIKKLAFFSTITNMFRGLVMSENQYNQHKFLIERLEIRSEVLDRMLTPEEVRGKYLFFLIIGIILIPIGVFFKLIWAVSIVTLIMFIAYPFRLRAKVQEEDEIIDVYFIDLYLLMYSKLRMGSKARLQKVVESYIDTLQIASNLDMQATMLKFARFFLNNLTMYEDHEAVPKLRDRYRSATIVNFCNVATQALQGIDNADTLLTLKMELTRRKTDVMKKNSEKLRIKGERAIYAIYIILFIFIAVGWYSKLPTGFF